MHIDTLLHRICFHLHPLPLCLGQGLTFGTGVKFALLLEGGERVESSFTHLQFSAPEGSASAKREACQFIPFSGDRCSLDSKKERKATREKTAAKIAGCHQRCQFRLTWVLNAGPRHTQGLHSNYKHLHGVYSWLSEMSKNTLSQLHSVSCVCATPGPVRT